MLFIALSQSASKGEVSPVFFQNGRRGGSDSKVSRFPICAHAIPFHISKVAFPFTAGRSFVEAVSIRVDVDTPGLAVDDAGKHGFTFGSSLANWICGNTCADESRSHMAWISPVRTKVSGLPFTILCSQVVSNVFGKQFSNIQASFGSFSLAFVVAIAFSTASDVNCRLLGTGRLQTYWVVEAAPANLSSAFQPYGQMSAGQP